MAKKKNVEITNFDEALSQIEKLYVTGAVFQYGKGIDIDVKSISTGSIKINRITGIGGIPRGRVTEIFGTESSGKTTLALHIVAEAQKAGGEAMFVDAEHALDIQYAKSLGVDIDALYLSQPDWGEQALEIVSKMLDSNKFDVIVVDSVAALVPKSEVDGEMGDAQMASQARMMSQAMRKLTSKVAKSHTALIFINQIRKKIGIMFGNPETTAGGEALKFYASMRIDIRRIGSIKEGEKVVANLTKVKIVKNKVSAPFKETQVSIKFGFGIDKYLELIDCAIENNVMEKKGAWISYQGVNKVYKFNSMETWRKLLIKKPKLYKVIRKKVLDEQN